VLFSYPIQPSCRNNNRKNRQKQDDYSTINVVGSLQPPLNPLTSQRWRRDLVSLLDGTGEALMTEARALLSRVVLERGLALQAQRQRDAELERWIDEIRRQRGLGAPI
jgi:hypothetical protein